MSQIPSSRVLIVLWKWKELKDLDSDYDEIAISNDENAKIIRINETKKEYFHNIFQDIYLQLSAIKDKKVILLLHNKIFQKKDWDTVKQNLNIQTKDGFSDPIFFGGGENYIYHQLKHDAGLLDQDQGFTIDEPSFYEDPISGKEIRQKVTVVDFESDNKTYTIKKSYFNKVWSYYEYKPKQRFFEFKETLFIHLIGCNVIQNRQGIKLFDFLGEQEHWLHKESTDLFNKALWATRLTDFYESENIQSNSVTEYYYSLVDFVYSRTFDEFYLRDLRNQFARLLGATTETIYG